MASFLQTRRRVREGCGGRVLSLLFLSCDDKDVGCRCVRVSLPSCSSLGRDVIRPDSLSVHASSFPSLLMELRSSCHLVKKFASTLHPRTPTAEIGCWAVRGCSSRIHKLEVLVRCNLAFSIVKIIATKFLSTLAKIHVVLGKFNRISRCASPIDSQITLTPCNKNRN